MRKNLFIISILIVLSFVFTGNVNALTAGRVTNDDGIVLRTGPGTNYNKAEKLYYNDTVIMLNTTPLKSSSGCSAGWYKISHNGLTRYVCSSYVSTSAVTTRVNHSSSINIRTGAGTGYSIYKSVPNDKLLTLSTTSKYSGSGCTSGWYKLNYNTSKSNYICSKYTDNYNSKSYVIVTNVSGAYLRKTASSSGVKIVKLKYGQALTLEGPTKYKGTGCSSGYYKVYYQGNSGYVCSSLVYNKKNTATINYLSGINIRKSASINSAKVTSLIYNTPLALESTTKYKGVGCSSGYYKVNINGTTAYACSKYVSTSSNITMVSTDSAIVRSGPGTNYSKLKQLSKLKTIILESTNKYSGTGCSNGWYKVSLDGSTGYICSSDTQFGSISSSSNDSSVESTKVVTSTKTSSGYYYTTNKWTYRLKENYGYVRSSASTSSSLKDTIYLGTEVKVLSSSGSSSGCSSGWYKISYYNNRTGYICKSLIEKYSDVTKTDTTYCNSLVSKGFPKSYCPYLSYLHSKHPNWVFVPEKTGVTFLAAVNGESERNYTQITESSYLASDSVQEVGGWRTASDAYVAYMLDPRNYLNEQNIFAFEDLGYDKTYHTKSAVRSIVDGTYLDTDTYAGYFLEAANKYNVSPVHLASRVKQEGGTNKSYAPVSGTVTNTCTVTGYVCSNYTTLTSKTAGKIDNISYVNLREGAGTGNSIVTQGRKDEKFTLLSTTKYSGNGCTSGWYKIKLTRSLKGIYNYYNIGAYGDNPVLRGLKTAAGCVDTNDGTPWDTRKKAIVYGAQFIADGYINQGQNTMYYQKFNTGPNATFPKYTHQYMTNILAPASESLSTYGTYQELGLIDKAYVFKIPVYNSMPTDHTSHPPVGNTDNYLSNIKIDNKEITGFSKSTLSYNFYISDKTTSVNVSAVKSSSSAKVSGTGKVATTSDKTTVNIKVTSEAGFSRTYKVYLIKTKDSSSLSPTQIVNKADVKINGSYLSGISAGTTVYGLGKIISQVAPTADITITNSSDTRKTGKLINGDYITIKNNGTSKKYTIIIKGDVYRDGLVNSKDLDYVDKYIKGSITISDRGKEAADTNYDGVINNTDYLRIQKHINKEIVLK